MTFILYRDKNCLTKTDKLWFHNHFKKLKIEMKNTNSMSKNFSLSLDKTHFLPGFSNKSPHFYLLKRQLIVDSLTPYFLADPRIEAPGVD